MSEVKNMAKYKFEIVHFDAQKNYLFKSGKIFHTIISLMTLFIAVWCLTETLSKLLHLPTNIHLDFSLANE